MTEKSNCKLCDCVGFLKGGVFAKKSCKRCKHKFEDHIVDGGNDRMSTNVMGNQNRLNLSLDINNNNPTILPSISPRGIITPRRNTIFGANLSSSDIMLLSDYDNPKKSPSRKDSNDNPKPTETVNNPSSTPSLAQSMDLQNPPKLVRKDTAQLLQVKQEKNPRLLDKMRTLSQKFHKVPELNEISSSPNQNGPIFNKNIELKKIIAKKEEERKTLKKKKKRQLEPQESVKKKKKKKIYFAS